ncbi:hypothetical protein N658DRAFT_97062 [Parathielavia hyrcaniae]|uniref:Secreted protein n=1 Tax=Parathielavia hyrcaniae TaxID=113614 RepID=A0AAN6Q2G4_9PEZI|nr:hypothetical protein N658DRAFT_97062 [Parathielavia hyrcaniae]
MQIQPLYCNVLTLTLFGLRHVSTLDCTAADDPLLTLSQVPRQNGRQGVTGTHREACHQPRQFHTYGLQVPSFSRFLVPAGVLHSRGPVRHSRNNKKEKGCCLQRRHAKDVAKTLPQVWASPRLHLQACAVDPCPSGYLVSTWDICARLCTKLERYRRWLMSDRMNSCVDKIPYHPETERVPPLARSESRVGSRQLAASDGWARMRPFHVLLTPDSSPSTE